MCSTNVYKLDSYAVSSSILTCGNMRQGCLVIAYWEWFMKFSHHLKLGKSRYCCTEWNRQKTNNIKKKQFIVLKITSYIIRLHNPFWLRIKNNRMLNGCLIVFTLHFMIASHCWPCISFHLWRYFEITYNNGWIWFLAFVEEFWHQWTYFELLDCRVA